METLQLLQLPTDITCGYCGNLTNYKKCTHSYNNEPLCDDCIINNNFGTCDRCGEYQPDINHYSNIDLCQSCYDSEYTTCENCGNAVYNDNTIYTHDDHLYCTDCDTQYWQCSECNTYYSTNIDNHEYNEDSIVCDRCAENLYYCDNCSTLRRDIYSCEHCDSTYCEYCEIDGHCPDCHHEDDEVDTRLPDISYARPGETIKSLRACGIEIETFGGNGNIYDTLSNLDCGHSSDCSIHGENSVEIQTPPQRGIDLERTITRLSKLLIDNQYTTNKSCGLHIHLDLTDYQDNPIILSRILRTYYAIEPVIYSMLPHSRYTNTYCLKLRDSFHYKDLTISDTLEQFYHKYYDIKNTDDQYYKRVKHDKYHSKRYFGVNCHSVNYRGTLELRMHSGTINNNKIINWIAINQNILDYIVSDNWNYKKIDGINKTKDINKQLIKMCKLFNITDTLKEYIINRIKIFNPDFNFSENLKTEEGYNEV